MSLHEQGLLVTINPPTPISALLNTKLRQGGLGSTAFLIIIAKQKNGHCGLRPAIPTFIERLSILRGMLNRVQHDEVRIIANHKKHAVIAGYDPQSLTLLQPYKLETWHAASLHQPTNKEKKPQRFLKPLRFRCLRFLIC